jgi:hypothetical protein
MSPQVIDHFRNVLDEMRLHRRVSVCLPGTVRAAGSTKLDNVLVQDISLGGALFRTDQSYSPDCHLTISIPFGDETYLALGVVKWASRMLDGLRLFAVGMEFEAVAPELQHRISHLEESDAA